MWHRRTRNTASLASREGGKIGAREKCDSFASLHGQVPRADFAYLNRCFVAVNLPLIPQLLERLASHQLPPPQPHWLQFLFPFQDGGGPQPVEDLWKTYKPRTESRRAETESKSWRPQTESSQSSLPQQSAVLVGFLDRQRPWFKAVVGHRDADPGFFGKHLWTPKTVAFWTFCVAVGYILGMRHTQAGDGLEESSHVLRD